MGNIMVKEVKFFLMEESTKEDGSLENHMAKEQPILVMVILIKAKSRMEKEVDLELIFFLMEESMWENGRMTKLMVKEL